MKFDEKTIKQMHLAQSILALGTTLNCVKWEFKADKVRELYNKGMTENEIADKLDLAPACVYTIMKYFKEDLNKSIIEIDSKKREELIKFLINYEMFMMTLSNQRA